MSANQRGTMGSHTVKSPTGADIEIVDDDDWVTTAGVELKSLELWTRSKPFVIRDLWEYGSVFDLTGGRATSFLYERIMTHYPKAAETLGFPNSLSTLMRDTVNAAAFERKTNGKRTYQIDLVALPEVWYEKLRLDIGGSMTTFTATPVKPVDTNGTKPKPIEPITSDDFERLIMPDVVVPEVASPIIEVEVASQVAMELLTRVVEIIAAGSVASTNPEVRQLRNELVHSQGLLGARLEENDRFRKQLRETGEELSAVKTERDGLRQRLRQTEANLNSALKGESAHAVTTEVMKRVDRIMRETPKPHDRGDES